MTDWIYFALKNHWQFMRKSRDSEYNNTYTLCTGLQSGSDLHFCQLSTETKIRLADLAFTVDIFWTRAIILICAHRAYWLNHLVVIKDAHLTQKYMLKHAGAIYDYIFMCQMCIHGCYEWMIKSSLFLNRTKVSSSTEETVKFSLVIKVIM
jgi:hypothetical protein